MRRRTGERLIARGAGFPGVRRVQQAGVVACKLDRPPVRAQERDGREMQGVKRANRNRERLERSRQHGRRQLDERNSAEKPARLAPMRMPS